MTKRSHQQLKKVATIKLTSQADIEAYLSKARRVLDHRQAEAEAGYWLIDHDEYSEAETFCLDCLQKHLPDFDWLKDIGERFAGGSYPSEEDGCCHCEECGKLLVYTLTDWGVNSELEHFEDWTFDWNSPIQCHEMARIAYGVFTDEQKRKLYKVLRHGKNIPEGL